MSGDQWSPASGTWQLSLVYTHEMFRVRVITRDWDVLRWCNVSRGQPHVKRNSLFAIFFLLKSRLNGQNWTAWYGVGKATMAKTREILAVFSWLFFHLISCLQRHRNFTNDLYYAIKCVWRIVFFFISIIRFSAITNASLLSFRMRGEHELCDRNANFQLPKFYVASNLNVFQGKEVQLLSLIFYLSSQIVR